MGKNTTCVHAGTYIDTRVGGVNTPVYTSSSYMFPNPEGNNTAYPRYSDIPTQKAAADKIAALENAPAGLITSSGLSAVSMCLAAFLGSGDHAVFQADLYGGTHHLLETQLKRMGVTFDLGASNDPQDVLAAVRDETRVIYVESPSNPLLQVIDLKALADGARALRAEGLVTIIDNTFATPINQRPLELGFDVVLHSATKYLGGHSDLCLGAIATSKSHMERILPCVVDFGANAGVRDCALLERSMKTLGLRVERHNANAMAVAEFLAGHPKIRDVHYPGLVNHPGHGVAASQMDGFGGMMSFELDGTETEAERIVSRLEYITPAISLGGVESLICFPARTSHAKMPPEARRAIGVSDTLLRLSVGIEDADDLIADLERAISG